MGDFSLGMNYNAWCLSGRRQKRLRCVAVIKATPEYAQACRSRASGSNMHRQPSPDPDDKETSKRAWEKQVMEWRHNLKLSSPSDVHAQRELPRR